MHPAEAYDELPEKWEARPAFRLPTPLDSIVMRQLEVENAELATELGNLLAVIHRDGGQYQSQHGTAKAVADARDVVIALRAESNRANGTA